MQQSSLASQYLEQLHNQTSQSRSRPSHSPIHENPEEGDSDEFNVTLHSDSENESECSR